MEIMSKERAEAYRAEYAKATRKWGGEVFQHFASDEEKERHLREVEEAKEVHNAPF